MKEGESSFASKPDKIAHQQTLDCYCPITVLVLNCYRLGIELLPSDLLLDF